MGPLFDSVQLRHKWLNSLVHGRYNKLVFMGFVNQQTYHLRGTILPRDTVLFSESVMGHPPGPFTSMNDGFPMIHWVYPCNVSSFYRYEGIIMVFIHLGLLSGWWFGTFFYFSIQLGMSSSQLTNSLHHFQRGRWLKTTNQLIISHH